jgi:hypothetical protein
VYARIRSPARYLLSLIYYYIIVMLLFIYWPGYAINKRSAGISADATPRNATTSAPLAQLRQASCTEIITRIINRTIIHRIEPLPFDCLAIDGNPKPIVRGISPTPEMRLSAAGLRAPRADSRARNPAGVRGELNQQRLKSKN